MADWEYARFNDPFADPDDTDPPTQLTKYEHAGACMRLGVINNLLDSLTPADAKESLLSFATRVKHGLRRHSRPRP